MSARQPLVSHALERAIAYCKLMFEAEMDEHPPGAAPTEAALAWRREATKYKALFNRIAPPLAKGKT